MVVYGPKLFNNHCIMSLFPGFAVPQLNYIGLCNQMSRDMRFPTFWYVRQTKAQTSLRIRAV